jgi:hypothetical protein
MTPKEKAQELFDKMYEYAIFDEAAKQCALIAVDEILESNPNYPEFKENEGTAIRFWELVKQEIEKL